MLNLVIQKNLFLKASCLSRAFSKNGIKIWISTSRIQAPALEHVWIREISPHYRRIERGDTLVNMPV